MAQTKKKRSRKHRGTQGGKVDARPKGRPQNRAEAKARAQSRRARGSGKSGKAAKRSNGAGKGGRELKPPSWASAARKGLAAAAIFGVLLAVAFQRPIAASAALAAFMLAFYVPMGYLTDRFFYQRRLREQQREHTESARQAVGNKSATGKQAAGEDEGAGEAPAPVKKKRGKKQREKQTADQNPT